MLRIILLLLLMFPADAFAQAAGGPHEGRSHEMDAHHIVMSRHYPAASVPSEPGQAAFAAIQEIVGILEADPTTDWSKVNIEALRQHLIDMDNVTLRAEVKRRPQCAKITIYAQHSCACVFNGLDCAKHMCTTASFQ